MVKKPEFGPYPRPGTRDSWIVATSAKIATPIMNKNARHARITFPSKSSSFASI